MPIPMFEVQFDKNANVFQPQQEADIVSFLTSAPGNQTTDVVALSHGWNNDMDEARTLYRNFLGNLESLLPPSKAGKVAAIGVLWPLKEFAEKDLIPSGAAAFDPFELLSPLLTAQIDQLKHALASADADAQLDAAAALLPKLENSPDAQREFVSRLGALLVRNSDAAQESHGEGTAKFAEQDGAELLQTLSIPMIAPSATTAGGGGAASFDDTPPPAGGAANLADTISSITAGASRLLNYFTYYVMKDRAGLVGRNGVNPLLSRIQAKASDAIRFHLAGHSFGGRLMTATVDGPNRLRINTLLLLQAAFSHNGFAHLYDEQQHDGFFLQVVAQKKV